MNDSKKTKQQLIVELTEARQKIAKMATLGDTPSDTFYQSSEMDGIFRKAFYTSPDIFIIANPDNGTYIEVNDSFSRITGYSRQELIGHSVIEFNLWVYPEELDKMTRLLADTGMIIDEEFHFRMKSGEIRRWLCSAEIVPFGDRKYTFAVATDITEQKKLQESAQYQANLIANVRDAIISSDLESKLVSWNKAAEKIYGWSQEEVIGKSRLDILRPEFPHNTIDEIREVLISTGHWQGEAIHETRDGAKLNVLVSTSLIKDDSGKNKGAVSIFTDITKRRQAEKKHEITLKTALDGFWLTDKTGKFMEVNDSYCKMIGYSKQELENMSISDIEAVETQEDILERIKGILKIGHQRFETKHRRKDDRIIDVEISTSYIEGEGLMSVFVRDISERKQAEEQIKIANERLRHLLQHNPSVVYSTRVTGNREPSFVSDNASHIVGYNAEEFLKDPKLWKNNIHPDDLKRLYDQEIYTLLEKGQHSCEYRFKHKNGVTIWVREEMTLVRNEYEEPLEIVGNMFDITERKQAEEKRQMILKTAIDGFAMIDLKGKILEVNESYSNMVGYTREELMNMCIADIDVTQKPEDVQFLLEQFIKRGSERFETKHRTKSGSIIDVELSRNLLTTEGGGQISVFVRDITRRKRSQEALRESESNYRALFQTMVQGVVYQDKNGNIISANPAAERILGLSLDQMTGRTSSDPRWKSIKEDGSEFPGEEHPAMVSLRTGEPVSGVPMGVFNPVVEEYRWIIINSVPEFREGDTKAYRVYTTFSDVTERIKHLEVIRQSEEKFFKAFRASPDSILITTLKDAIIIDTNDGYQQQSGFSREEVIGKKIADLHHWVIPEDRQKAIELIQKQGYLRNREVQLRAKTGQIHDVLLSAELITIDGETCMISVAHDITERKKAEEALKESAAQLQGILRAAPIGIALVKDRAALWVNEHLCKLIGYSSEELVGVSGRILYASEEEFTRVGQNIENHIGLYGKGEIETQLLSKNGRIIDVLSISTPLDPDDITAGNIVTIMDITERKKAQERERETKNLRELDRLRTELLANVSHELRTPLASIKGFTTVMMDYEKKLTSGEKRDYLEIIDNNADRLSELIEQLLVMSRLGAGLLTIEKERYDIRQLCRDVVAEAKIRIPEYRFILKLPASLPRVDIDAKRIRQVLDNLVDNAVKNSPPDSKISISAQKDTDKVLVTVTDQGLGIPAEDQPRIFDRMFHTERKHKRGRSGAGLGLSICKGLVEAHDGRIWIESEESKGTRCFFTLPIHSAGGDSHGKKDKDEYHSLLR